MRLLTAFVGPALALGLLAVVFGFVERRWPALPAAEGERRRLRREDLGWWFFTPLLGELPGKALVVVSVVLVALLLGREPAEFGEALKTARGVAAGQPAWVVAVELLFLGDLLGYLSHRAFHGRRLWRFHAVHHATTDLRWISALRVHPVNDALPNVLLLLPLVLAGFPATGLAAVVPLLAVHGLLLHANVPWDFGPLRFVIASPSFHRWHHSTEVPACNFAGLFPVLDLVFRTLHLPRDVQPRRFGVAGDAPPPEGVLAGLAWPFRKSGRDR